MINRMFNTNIVLLLSILLRDQTTRWFRLYNELLKYKKLDDSFIID